MFENRYSRNDISYGILFKYLFFFSFFFTCKAVKNGKYMSGSSYFPPPTPSVRSINCLPSKAEKKYAYNDSVTT